VTRAAALDELRAAFAELLGADRRLRGRDPSNGQVRALFLLASQEEATAGELAKHAELSPASMTAMLDQLERSGVVVRRRSDTDRRQVIVTLTDAGREQIAERRAAWEQRWRAALGAHSDEEVEAALRVMRTIAGLLDELGR
jgi:DNA-binding MarR family transcriptional regulator